MFFVAAVALSGRDWDNWVAVRYSEYSSQSSRLA